MRAFSGKIARWFRLRADAAGGRSRGRNRALPEAPVAAQNRSSQFAAVRCAERVRTARRGDAEQSRASRIAQHARHELACSARPDRNTDGRAKIALLDFAAAPGSDRARMPSANDRQSFARAGLARFDSDGIEIDPRYRTRGRAIESGFRQRARPGRFESVASANPEAESGTAENARSPRLRRKSGERGR